MTDSCAQKTEKLEKGEIKKVKASKASKEKNYELPEIPDYERAVLEKPQEFEFSDRVRRDKTKLDRPASQVIIDSYDFISLPIIHPLTNDLSFHAACRSSNRR